MRKVCQMLLLSFMSSTLMSAGSVLDEGRSSIEVRVGFCKIMNVNNCDKKTDQKLCYSSLLVRNVCGKIKLSNNVQYQLYEYSPGYAVVFAENVSGYDVLLPYVHGPEWSIIDSINKRCFPKSIPWISSRIENEHFCLRPKRIACFLVGSDYLPASNIVNGFFVRCESYNPRFSLVSNKLGDAWVPKHASRQGLNLGIVGIANAQENRENFLALLSLTRTNSAGEVLADVQSANIVNAVLLLSNVSDKGMKVKGFSSAAWHFAAEDQGIQFDLPISNLVNGRYLNDFIIDKMSSKAIAFGFPSKISCNIEKIHISYREGDNTIIADIW